jgi:aspartyl-tRNA(Asn)/glutamyl-tRNA(Gln) amidotransferase subunit B
VQAAYFDQVAKRCGDGKLAANWVMGELARHLNQHDIDIKASPVSADQLGGLLERIRDNTLSGNIAKKVFELMWQDGGTADEIIEARGLKQVTDTGAIEKVVDEVIANSARQVAQYKAAPVDKRGKMLGFFMGQVMKASGGKANPGAVTDILKQKLDALL